MAAEQEPVHVSAALSELIQRRGYAQSLGRSKLRNAWEKAVGSAVAKKTRVVGINRGALQIEVSGSALLSELASFRRSELLRTLREQQPELKIKELKFRLNGSLGK